MMLLNTLKVHHITGIVTGDRLIMEQVINRVGEGYNISTAIVDTPDSTTITQLLAATGLGRFPIRRGVVSSRPRASLPTEGPRGLVMPEWTKARLHLSHQPARMSIVRGWTPASNTVMDSVTTSAVVAEAATGRTAVTSTSAGPVALPMATGQLLVPSDRADKQCGRVGEIASPRFQTSASLAE